MEQSDLCPCRLYALGSPRQSPGASPYFKITGGGGGWGAGISPCPLQLSPNKTASWGTVKPELWAGEPERWEGWNKGLSHGNHSSIVELDIRRKQTWSLTQSGLIKSKHGSIQQNPWVSSYGSWIDVFSSVEKVGLQTLFSFSPCLAAHNVWTLSGSQHLNGASTFTVPVAHRASLEHLSGTWLDSGLWRVKPNSQPNSIIGSFTLYSLTRYIPEVVIKADFWMCNECLC